MTKKKTQKNHIKINKIFPGRQGQLSRGPSITQLLQIFDKNVIEHQKTMRVLPLAVGNPTDDGITLATIIGLLYAAAPNDGAIDESSSTMTCQKPKPGDRQVQGQEQKIEVHPNA